MGDIPTNNSPLHKAFQFAEYKCLKYLFLKWMIEYKKYKANIRSIDKVKVDAICEKMRKKNPNKEIDEEEIWLNNKSVNPVSNLMKQPNTRGV